MGWPPFFSGDAQFAYRIWKALGYPDDHPQVIRAACELKKLEHETENDVRIEPCFRRFGTTAIVAICLHESGISENHPALKKSAEWLIEKEIRFRGDWIHKNPAKVEPSGWVFEFNNKWNPDVDDTAMVLLALRKIPTDDPQKRDECFQRGLKWMMTFQCKTAGGRRSTRIAPKIFSKKFRSPIITPCSIPNVPTSPRAFWNCSATKNWNRNHLQIHRAIEFIREHQEPDGSWYGRWA